MQKEQKLLNWEEKLREEEAKQMQAFEKQKQSILGKKMRE